MPIQHTLAFGIYHWDTFDNATLLVGQARTLADAQDVVQQRYGARIRGDGADRVDIVDSEGVIVAQHKVG